MVRGDIIAALRNALERGEDFGKAKQSLINAGYSAQEVVEAASVLISEEKEAEIVLPAIEEKKQIKESENKKIAEKPQRIMPSEAKAAKESFIKKIIEKAKKDKFLLLLGVFIILLIILVISFFVVR